MTKTEIIEDIASMMRDAAAEDINFLYCHNRPTFRRGGATYEIVTIRAPYEPGGDVELECIQIDPYVHAIAYIPLESTFRRRTLERISGVVERELEWIWL